LVAAGTTTAATGVLVIVGRGVLVGVAVGSSSISIMPEEVACSPKASQASTLTLTSPTGAVVPSEYLRSHDRLIE